MRKLVVSSNCQTGELAATLKAIFPSDEVMAEPLPGAFANDVAENEFVAKLSGADYWITIGKEELANKYNLRGLGSDLPTRVVEVPAIAFGAFHPDLSYARIKSTGALTHRHYNSAIVIWAYRNSIDPMDASKLFNARVFRKLGYFDQWKSSVDILRSQFKARFCDDLFNSFMLNVQRSSCFMYTVNHPKPNVMVRLGKLIALKMGANAAILDKTFEIEDGLSTVVWPIYPEIAEHYSLSGGDYCWKLGVNEYVSCLHDYVSNSYAEYQAQRISHDDLVLVNRDCLLLDVVLRSELGMK